MPIVNSVTPDYCVHGGIHAFWIAQGTKWRVCNLPKPRLLNSIRMLERSLDGYNYPIMDIKLRLKTEDQLRILVAELERRNGSHSH